MKKHTIFVGLDVHKDSIDIAFAEDGRDGEVEIMEQSQVTSSPWKGLFENCAVKMRICDLSMKRGHVAMNSIGI